jgi:outer membrane protein assembly factor BamB
MSNCRKKLLLFSICAFVGAVWLDAQAAESDVKYFCSNHGLADPSCGALPSQFDAPGTLRWRVPLDPGHATPIVSDGRIFLTAYQAESHELTVLAIDSKTGRILWHNGVIVSQVERTHPLGSPATATPACDGRRVYVFFGSYGLLAFDLNGKKLWEFKAGQGHSQPGSRCG